MKVIFLDYDGVLNTNKTPTKMVGDVMTMAEPTLVFTLNKLVDKSEAELVLSSSWRNLPNWEDAMKKSGIIKKFYGKTPETKDGVEGPRGVKIQAWLDKHPEVERYAIIDDCDDMTEGQMPNFFQTDEEVGLTEEIADKILTHLSDA